MPWLQAENGPGAIALAAVVLVIGAEAQLVEKTTERQQGKFRQGQQEKTQVGAFGHVMSRINR